MTKKILTLHPEGKQGVNIDKAKYEQIKTELLRLLNNKSPQSFSELFAAMNEELDGRFDGSISWYTESVKLDLEARGVISHDRKTKQISLEHAQA